MTRALAALLQLDARKGQGKRHVVLDGHRRDQVEGLEDRSVTLQAVVGEIAVGQLAERQARTIDVAGGWAVEPTHQREQRALAASGGADDRHELARADVESHVPQRRHLHLVAAAELARDGIQAQPHRLAEQVAELVGLGLGPERRNDSRLGDHLRRVEHGGARLSVPVRSCVLSFDDRCGGLPTRAAAVALGAARLTWRRHD